MFGVKNANIYVKSVLFKWNKYAIILEYEIVKEIWTYKFGK